MPGAQFNVNPARAITWFEGVTIYCTFFNYISPPPRQFLYFKKKKTLKTKYFKKKLVTIRGMLIEQIFELRGPAGPSAVYVLLELADFMTKQ